MPSGHDLSCFTPDQSRSACAGGAHETAGGHCNSRRSGGMAAPVLAQPKVYRIGYIATRFNAPLWQSFLDDLRKHGWEDSRNVVVEGRWAEARLGGYLDSRPSLSPS